MAARLTFGEYLRGIRHAFLARNTSGRRKALLLLDVIGRALEDARTQWNRSIAQFTPVRGEGNFLDDHGRDRRLPRVSGESNESYRAHLLGAFDRYQRMGTGLELQEILARFGFTATVTPRYEGYGPKGPIYPRLDWNVFDVLLSAVTGVYGFETFINLIRGHKSARDQAVIVIGPGVALRTFDDWEPEETPKTLDDDGTFDDF